MESLDSLIYAEAIEIVTSEHMDFKRLVIDIAKTNPGLVVRAAGPCWL